MLATKVILSSLGLKGSRCDIFQGYYFAKPMPYAEIEAFLSHPASHAPSECSDFLV
ncbi:putative signal transduction protein with EAL and GGDEF domain [Pseudomonas frederiksbergensis]